MTNLPSDLSNPPVSVFQTDLSDASRVRTGGRFGFFGRVVEGMVVAVLAMTVAVLTLTTAARSADAAPTNFLYGPVPAISPLADATGNHPVMIMIALCAIMAVLGVAVARTWKQTAKGIAAAPRRSHRVG